jgi:hypothetical protein
MSQVGLSKPGTAWGGSERTARHYRDRAISSKFRHVAAKARYDDFHGNGHDNQADDTL